MHEELIYNDRIYLVWIEDKPLGVLETVALANKGVLTILPEFDHGRDAGAVELFKNAYDLRRNGQ